MINGNFHIQKIKINYSQLQIIFKFRQSIFKLFR